MNRASRRALHQAQTKHRPAPRREQKLAPVAGAVTLVLLAASGLVLACSWFVPWPSPVFWGAVFFGALSLGWILLRCLSQLAHVGRLVRPRLVAQSSCWAPVSGRLPLESPVRTSATTSRNEQTNTNSAFYPLRGGVTRLKRRVAIATLAMVGIEAGLDGQGCWEHIRSRDGRPDPRRGIEHGLGALSCLRQGV